MLERRWSLAAVWSLARPAPPPIPTNPGGQKTKGAKRSPAGWSKIQFRLKLEVCSPRNQRHWQLLFPASGSPPTSLLGAQGAGDALGDFPESESNAVLASSPSLVAQSLHVELLRALGAWALTRVRPRRGVST
jgi:hypothetical protein